MIGKEIQDIERDFASPYRGDRRLKNDPTMKAADDLRLPRHLRISFETVRLSQSSTHMMLTRNGRWGGLIRGISFSNRANKVIYRLNMYSVSDLLSSEDIYDLPSPDQPPRDASQSALTPVHPSLLPDNGESSTGTWTTQTQQAFENHAQDTRLPSHSAQTSDATLHSSLIDAELEYGLSPDSLTWNIASGNRDWRLEGGMSNEFPDGVPPNNSL